MNSNRPRPRAKSQAFTLVELLTVIAIVGILAAIIIPIVGSVRASAASSKALSNAKQLGMANLLYSQENRNQLLGLRDGNHSWNGIQFLLNQTARYITRTPGGNNDITIEAHKMLVDPLVPENLQIYSNTYYHTWSINRLFNVNGGRTVDGTGPWVEGTNGAGRPRTMLEFDSPPKVIYAVSGGYELTVGNAAMANLLTPPTTARQAIFYFHRGGKATPAVYLDGHVELIDYPIPPKQINPNHNL